MLCFDVDFMGFPYGSFIKMGTHFKEQYVFFMLISSFGGLNLFFFSGVLEAHFNATWTTHLQTHLLTFASKIHEVPIKPKMVH